MDDSAYIIEIHTDENESYQVFAISKFEMMSVLKKVLGSESELVTSIQSIGAIMTAKDFLDVNPDLNFGSQEE